MTDDLYIGSAPVEEDCAQVGTEGYWQQAKRECRALIDQLRRVFGPEPPGCRLYLKQNPHDFGPYLSVNCRYESENEAAVTYAYRCEAELPFTWDDEARKYVGDTIGTTKYRKGGE